MRKILLVFLACSLSCQGQTGFGVYGGPSVATWAKYTISMSGSNWTVNGVSGDAKANATTQQVALVTLPAKTVMHGVVVEHTVPFAGTAINAVTASVGTSGASTSVATDYDVHQAITALPYLNGGLNRAARTDATIALVVEIKTTGANASALTAGSVNVYLQTSTLP